jgi:hypothetical protein
MKHIAISIEYAGLTLPVVKNDAGVDVVPLKPISDLFGLDWMGQYKKVRRNWRAGFLGVCVADVFDGFQARSMLCLRVDRVEFYILSINPKRVRSAGNATGADFVQEKHEEWANSFRVYMAHLKLISGSYFAGRAESEAIAQAFDRAARSIFNGIECQKERDWLLGAVRKLAADAGVRCRADAFGAGDLFAGQ